MNETTPFLHKLFLFILIYAVIGEKMPLGHLANSEGPGLLSKQSGQGQELTHPFTEPLHQENIPI